MYVLCCCCCCLLLFLLFVLGFVCLFLYFSFLFFLFSLAALRSLWALGSPASGRAWASGMGAPSPGRWTTREFPGPENINWCVHSQRYPNQHKDPAPHRCLWAPVLDTSWQTTSKPGTQCHPSADRLPKVILSSQTPQNMPLDLTPSFRGKRLSSIHQSAGTSP